MGVDLPPDGELISLNVAEMRLVRLGGQTVKTGIYKRPVEGRRRVEGINVEGDRQADRSVHGGHDKAVYSYASEDYLWWTERLGRSPEPGLFGENLTTTGLGLSDAVIGERWRIGEATLEVSEPRLPCSKLGLKLGDQRLVGEFARALRPGAYLRIIGPGEIGAGDTIEVISRPDHGLTIALMARALLGDRTLLEKLLAAPQISASWRRWAADRLGGQ